MTRARLTFLLLALSLAPSALLSQERQGEDPFASVLFTAEEIMLHRRAIGLNDEQRDAITRLIEDLQGRAVALQWRLLDETETLKEVLQATRVDQDRAMDRFQRVLNIEMEIKQVHLQLLIRIKNLLTPQQQEELLRLRAGEETSEGGRAPGTGPASSLS